MATMNAGLKTWRESSSLILVAKTTFTPQITVSDFNYKLLAVKRSTKSGFMPNTYVFPGGNSSSADKSKDWLKLYEKFGFKMDSFEKIRLKQNQPLILQNDNNPDVLPKYLSLRIGAIRETFEECGILICRSYKINYKERIARWASFIGGPEIKKWQDKVHEDPENFLELCHKFEVYPDVWALKAWSNWATPSTMKVRYDTIFFLASFHQTPAAHAEKQEIQHLEWATPKEYILRNRKDEIMLPPPQFYEISRLGNFLDIDHLSKFANERAELGIERYLPWRINSEQGLFTVLPGDELYPENIDTQVTEIPTLTELPDSHVQNRWATPKEHILRNQTDKIKLHPAQFYEISRMGNFLDIDHLSKFAHERAELGMENYLASRIDTPQGTFHVLPGDELYPGSIKAQSTDVPTLPEIPDSHIQNRVVHSSPSIFKLAIKNLKPKYNHRVPIDYSNSEL